MTKSWFLLWTMVLIGVLAAACTLVSETAATPMPVDGGEGEAVIEDVEIVILESFPVQVRAKVTGQLPDVCAVIEGVDQVRAGNTFRIDLIVARRPDARCAPNVTPFEHTVALDVYGLKAGTYTVEVGSKSTTFELATDNVLPEVALVWQRAGGIAGFCDELVVYTTGEAVKQSCKGGTTRELGGGGLIPEQLDQLLAWYTELAPFQYEEKDPAVADAMTVRVDFHGIGRAEASEAQQVEIQDWAAQLWADLSQPG